METIQGITEHPVLLTNGEGEDDDDEWHLLNFGRDDDFWQMYSIYKILIDEGHYAYGGGWAEQLAIHREIIDLFMALDATIERPKNGHS